MLILCIFVHWLNMLIEKVQVEREVLGQLGPFRGVKAVYEESSGRSAGVRKSVLHDHHLFVAKRIHESQRETVNEHPFTSSTRVKVITRDYKRVMGRSLAFPFYIITHDDRQISRCDNGNNNTFLRARMENKPTKLTVKRKPIIQPSERFFTLAGVFPPSACAAMCALIPNR